MKTQLPARLARKVDAVAIGASAGGIDALLVVLAGLHAPRASIIVVLHLPDGHESQLAQVFQQRLGIAVQEAQPRQPLRPATVYLAPPGYHLLVEADRSFSLSCDPPVLYSRPSIDVMMESCADVFGPALAGLLLTGANEDGAQGLASIARAGGLTAVQDPQEALHDIMPRAALAAMEPDFVLPLAGLRDLLHTITQP